ncbi:hypothetical protein [Streptomyces huasconensis]|uniref:hypothetical protein n=1 Tax=Streptomyces huasconensis TaxID=1854574 RepID=UPI003701534E
MPTGNPDSFWSKRRIGLAAFFLSAPVVIFLYVQLGPGEWRPTSPVAIALLTTVAALGAYVLRPPDAEAGRVSEGRERVREAEHELEQALRLPTGEAMVVHGDVYISSPPGSASDARQDGDEPPLPGGDIGGARRARARLTLTELWTVTHRRLDLYHDIALGQASRSFRNAQIAMILGFALLVGFVIIALQASTTAGAVVAGGLGAVAAALAGYVSRTFVRSQEAAASHLRAYFDQPLEFSRYLAAERLVADANLSDEQRAEIVSALAQAMISGPPLPNEPGPDTARGA